MYLKLELLGPFPSLVRAKAVNVYAVVHTSKPSLLRAIGLEGKIEDTLAVRISLVSSLLVAVMIYSMIQSGGVGGVITKSKDVKSAPGVAVSPGAGGRPVIKELNISAQAILSLATAASHCQTHFKV